MAKDRKNQRGGKKKETSKAMRIGEKEGVKDEANQ